MNMINQALRDLKTRVSSWKTSAPPPSLPPFYLETDFSAAADLLRTQYEKQIVDSVEVNDGLTPLLYAFCPETYQFLTANAERIFSRDALGSFTEALREWARTKLKASYVSTPQLRVYIGHCWRDFLADSTEAHWHYMLALSRSSEKKSGEIKLVVHSQAAGPQDDSLSLERVVSLPLQFNQLLIHDASFAYSVARTRAETDPLNGPVFLDGYLW
jgi:hypothetical protein